MFDNVVIIRGRINLIYIEAISYQRLSWIVVEKKEQSRSLGCSRVQWRTEVKGYRIEDTPYEA